MLYEVITGDVRIVSAVLGPVTNLLEGAMGKDCTPFYNGKLTHPRAK